MRCSKGQRENIRQICKPRLVPLQQDSPTEYEAGDSELVQVPRCSACLTADYAKSALFPGCMLTLEESRGGNIRNLTSACPVCPEFCILRRNLRRIRPRRDDQILPFVPCGPHRQFSLVTLFFCGLTWQSTPHGTNPWSLRRDSILAWGEMGLRTNEGSSPSRVALPCQTTKQPKLCSKL